MSDGHSRGSVNLTPSPSPGRRGAPETRQSDKRREIRGRHPRHRRRQARLPFSPLRPGEGPGVRSIPPQTSDSFAFCFVQCALGTDAIRWCLSNVRQDLKWHQRFPFGPPNDLSPSANHDGNEQAAFVPCSIRADHAGESPLGDDVERAPAEEETGSHGHRQIRVA